MLRRGYEARVWYEKTYHGCSQCVLAAIMDVMGERDDQIFRFALTSGQPAALPQAIHGLGGVGKTQLAVEYAYRHAS